MNELDEDFVSACNESHSNISDSSKYKSMESIHPQIVQEKSNNVVDVYNPDYIQMDTYEIDNIESGMKKTPAQFLKPEEYRIYLQFKNTPHLSSWPFLKGFIQLYEEYCQLLEQPLSSLESENVEYEDPSVSHINQNIRVRKTLYNQNRRVIQFCKSKLKQIKFLGQVDKEAVFYDRIECDIKPKIDVYIKKMPQAVVTHKIKFITPKRPNTNDAFRWIRLPIALELLLPNVQKQIQKILSSCDFLCDPLEVVAELRTFNYNVGATIDYFRDTKDIRSVIHDSKLSKIYTNQYRKLFQMSSTNLRDIISIPDSLNNQNFDLPYGPRGNYIGGGTSVTAKPKDLPIELNFSISGGDDEKVTKVKSSLSDLKEELERIKAGRELLKDELTNLNSDFTQIKQDLQYYITKFMNARSLKNDGMGNLELREKINILARQVEELKVKLRDEEKRRRYIYNAMQEQVGNIRVYCRCRNVDQKASLALVKGNTIRLRAMNQEEFSFEKIFTPQANQGQIFEEFLQLIESYIDGFNVSFITYGSEASGKTFTLIGQPTGNPVDYGLMQRALGAVLSEGRKKARDWEYQLSVGIVEIYNEDYRDFVSGTQHLQLYIEQGLEAIFQNLKKIDINDESDVNDLVGMCYEKRISAKTALNPASSRSHLICIFRLQGRSRIHGEKFVSFLSLCDLAGFEDIIKADTHKSKTLTSEAGYINRSLTAFNRLFSSLRKQDPATACYRDTKLTHILKPFLTNSGKCALIMTIRTDKESLPSTVSTLKFGREARGINLGKALRQIDMTQFDL